MRIFFGQSTQEVSPYIVDINLRANGQRVSNVQPQKMPSWFCINLDMWKLKFQLVRNIINKLNFFCGGGALIRQ